MMLKRSRLSVVAVCFLLLCSCYHPPVLESPEGYDLVHPERILLTSETLHEISGLAFHRGNFDSIYAINDEQGKLYAFTTRHPQPVHAKYGRSGDYEDLAISGNQVVVLKSNGTLYLFPLPRLQGQDAENVQTAERVLPKGEYEGLFADSSGELYVMCKHCEEDASRQLSIYRLRADSGLYKQVSVSVVDVKKIRQLSKEDKLRFNPSCLAKHPLTNEWYILSSVNKLLVVTDPQFQVKKVYHLKPNLFRQPEGMAFDPKGNLYISNEGKDEDADLLLFRYSPPPATKK